MCVVVPANEVDRLRAEELPGDVAVRVTDWWAPLLGPDLAPGTPGVLHEDEAVAAEGLRAARASLLPGERERYRRLGRDTAEALTATALTLQPGTTERQAGAPVGAELMARGVDPVVVLVAGGGAAGLPARAAHHRSPGPAGNARRGRPAARADHQRDPVGVLRSAGPGRARGRGADPRGRDGLPVGHAARTDAR
ncbi:hypothetical protein [Geodermatophilus maliterrae]|uniref:Universal stress protein family protein n=1 Tax=Geodermatophilus maliterrae TaxID=3162531 RepID=A0ABV3XDZ0_9ACTN